MGRSESPGGSAADGGGTAGAAEQLCGDRQRDAWWKTSKMTPGKMLYSPSPSPRHFYVYIYI